MTSCLDDGETFYSGSFYPAYITSSESEVVYARTLEGLPITSSLIKLEYPGTFVFIKYSWTESQNTITEEGIYNVTVSEISDPIEQTILRPTEAPVLETELPLAFEPYYLFDYHLISEYSYEKGDGAKKRLAFYCDFSEVSENEIVIDVRLENDPSGDTVDKDQNKPVAVNISALNEYYSTDLSSGSTKEVRVYFQYYRKKNDETLELYKTLEPYRIKITKE